MTKIYKKIGILILACLIIFSSLSFYVYFQGSKYLINSSEDITNINPPAKVVIILGARVYPNRLSDMLADRVDTAIDLYNLGIVEKILVSGDHGTRGYDEVNAIKDYLLEKNIPGEDIFLDHAGFNTYNSMYRAKHIFEIDKAIISTQKFHLPRALYLARGLDIEAYGLAADKRVYTKQGYNNVREFLARVKAWFNLNLKKSPRFLGEKIPLTSDSQSSWDIKVIDDEFLNTLVLAAIKQTKSKVVYDPTYYSIDYPGGDIPADRGVCTDVIIRAYRSAGIDLQEKVHEDMKNNFQLYPNNWGLNAPDTNIDHRRVPNLETFFSRFGTKLNVSSTYLDYLPGDIVVWKLPNNLSHIGLVSNYYKKDTPLIIHNIGAGPQLENILFTYEIIAHYRYR